MASLRMSLGHRERVLSALNHKEPDRVPVDLGGLACSIVNSPPHGYTALCQYLGLKNVFVKYKPGSYIPDPLDERLLKIFDIDFRHIRINLPMKEVSLGIIEDIYGVKWKTLKRHLFPIDPPLKDIENINDIEEYQKWPNAKNPVLVEGKLEEAKKLFETTDFALVADPDVGIFHRYSFMRGFSQWMLDMKLNPELYRVLADKILDVYLSMTVNFLNEIGDYVLAIIIADDMGSSVSPFLSLKDYRKFVKPWFKKCLDMIKNIFPGIKILYHCCGAVYPLIPEFIECGVDILNPIQPFAAGMNPKKLKDEFGNKLCFHGGIDVQRTLPFGTTNEVKEHVKEVIGSLASGGGYILAPSHEIHVDIPPENIYTMYKTALEYK